LEKIVHAKEDKGYNAKEYRFVDKTIGEEYSVCFPFGHHPILDMTILIERLKRFPPNIVYWPMLNIHVDEIKRRITQYNKFDTKAPFFAIPEDLALPNCIMPKCPKN
jgi:hypothetical protein